MIYVRFEGRSYDLPETLLGLDSAPADVAIRRRIAQFLEVRSEKLESYVIDRRPNGDIVVRPEAVYG